MLSKSLGAHAFRLELDLMVIHHSLLAGKQVQLLLFKECVDHRLSLEQIFAILKKVCSTQKSTFENHSKRAALVGDAHSPKWTVDRSFEREEKELIFFASFFNNQIQFSHF